MMRIMFAAAIPAMLAVATPIRAAPVVFEVIFTATTGTQAPSGFFTYDSTMGPAGTFSNFQLTHRGKTYDFTAPANAASGAGCSAGKSAFDIMADTTGCASNQVWYFLDGEFINTFDLFASPDALVPDTGFMPFNGVIRVLDTTANGDGPDDGGTFTIVPRGPNVPVPEPMALTLFGLGLTGLAAARRRATRRDG